MFKTWIWVLKHVFGSWTKDKFVFWKVDLVFNVNCTSVYPDCYRFKFSCSCLFVLVFTCVRSCLFPYLLVFVLVCARAQAPPPPPWLFLVNEIMYQRNFWKWNHVPRLLHTILTDHEIMYRDVYTQNTHKKINGTKKKDKILPCTKINRQFVYLFYRYVVGTNFCDLIPKMTFNIVGAGTSLSICIANVQSLNYVN